MGRVRVHDGSSSMSLQRLLNGRMLELRRQFLSSSASGQERSAHLRRNLFGPTDSEENLRFAQEEMERLSRADCKRWNFDFEAEKPREGQFAWQAALREGVAGTSSLPALTCCTSSSSSSSSQAATCLTTHASTTPSLASPTTNGRSVKRLHHKAPPKAAIKLCTDYFSEVKASRQVDKSRFKLNSELLGSVKTVNTKLSELLKIQSTNTN